MDGGAVRFGVEKVEEEVYCYFTAEERAGRWVDEEKAVEKSEGGGYQEVVGVIYKSLCQSAVSGVAVLGNVLLPMPSSRSRQLTSLEATLYSNPSCSLKNSRNAGSSGSSPRVFGDEVLDSGETDARRLDGAECADVERQIWASNPSICRRPFRIFSPSLEEMLSKERDSNVSMLKVIAL